jgi:uncharacterized protein YecT (DUF1311 family)
MLLCHLLGLFFSMKYLFLFAFVLQFSFSQTQAEMNQMAYNDYKKSDSILNVTFKKIQKAFKNDKPFLKALKDAQLAWIKHRDAELEMKYPPRDFAYYGSMHPMCRAIYLQELTEERNKKLELWLNINEDDGCGGTNGY